MNNCVILLWLTFGLTHAGNLQVITENGVLQGKQLTTSNGDVIEAFLGVPYAQPPIGKLRFRPPRDPLSWNSVRDATLPPPSCYQRRDEFFEDGRDSQDNQPLYGPSEDCLFVNIYAPDHQNKSVPDNGYPVLVWFHGGGFSFGSSFSRGSPNWSPDPRELVSEGQIIVVNVQYRLGSFGFLFLDDEFAPGNMGLLDQQLALNWIKRNIFAFRGDPTKVTLGGQDSGGVSALMQAIVTKKEPFYKTLILQSSGIQHPWSFIDPTEAFRRTLKLAALLGCSVTGSRQDVLGCLIQKSPEDIVNKEMGVVAFPTINFHPFVMTVDGKIINTEPRKILYQWVKKQKDVSVLLGSNGNEGTKSLVHFMPTVFPRQELAEEILDRDTFNVVVNRLFADSPIHVQKAIKFQYTNWTDSQSDQSRFKLLTKMVADHQYDCPLDETVTLMAARFKIFRYLFTVNSPQDQWPKWTGVKHGDEMDYILGRPLLEPLQFSVKDVFLSKFLIQSWTKFVNTGHPSGFDKGRVIGWPLYQPDTKHVLHIQNSGNNEVISNKNEEFCSFWNDLVPVLKQYHDDECHKREKIRNFEKQKFKPLRIKTTAQPDSQEDLEQKVQRRPAAIRRSTTMASLSTSTTQTPSTSSSMPTITTTKTTKATSLTTRINTSTTSTTVAPTSSELSFMEKPVFEESEDLPPPINVLSKTSILSAADPSFKLVTSEDVITDEDLLGHSSDQLTASLKQESNPEAQKISYSLSVMNRMPSLNSEDWTLFRPEEPGNSPIYIARGTYGSPATTTTIPTTTTRAPFRRNQHSVVPNRRRPLGSQKPTSTESSSHTKIYDPFNPATYTRSMLTKRTGAASIVRLNGDGRGNPFYYPNIAPGA